MKHTKKSLLLMTVSLLMIIFGFTEIVTAFTHSFFGITTAKVNLFTYSAFAIGLCYALSGALVLTKKKWARLISLMLLALVIAGRLALVVTGLYPLSTFEQVIGIVGGTAIAIIFAIYIWINPKLFHR